MSFCVKPQYFVHQFLLTRDWEVTQTTSLLRFQHLYLWARGCFWCNISFYFAFLFYILTSTWHITHSSLSVNIPVVSIAPAQFLLSLLFCPDWWSCSSHSWPRGRLWSNWHVAALSAVLSFQIAMFNNSSFEIQHCQLWLFSWPPYFPGRLVG